MSKPDHAAPATKGDIIASETGLRAEIKATESALRSDLEAVEVRLDKKIDRVAAELVRTQADVRAIRASMATKDDVGQILSAIDAFAQMGEAYDRKAVSHGAILNDHTAAIRDHGRRLDSLEAKG